MCDTIYKIEKIIDHSDIEEVAKKIYNRRGELGLFTLNDIKAWLGEVVNVDKIYDILDSVIYRQFQFKNKLMNDDDIRNLAKEIANLTKQEG